MGLDFPSVRATLAEWEGRRVTVAVDRERLKTGFKPMVALQGALGGVEAVPEVGPGAGHSKSGQQRLATGAADPRAVLSVGDGDTDDLHGSPGFYISLSEFDYAAENSLGLLTITGRNLEIFGRNWLYQARFAPSDTSQLNF
jgi:hypothetical protein